MIPVIDIAALFGPSSGAREAADRAIADAAAGIGFMTVTGFPGSELLSRERRADLLRLFAIPEAEKAKLLRWNFDPTRKNVYRGWFPLQHGGASYKEGIDMGPDLVRGGGGRARRTIRFARQRRCRRTPWFRVAQGGRRLLHGDGGGRRRADALAGARTWPRRDDLRRSVQGRHLDAQADPLSACARRSAIGPDDSAGRPQGPEPPADRRRACQFRPRHAAGAGRRRGPAGAKP